MEHGESKRREKIATIIALITVLCILCALALVLTRDDGRIAFNTATLVAGLKARIAWL